MSSFVPERATSWLTPVRAALIAWLVTAALGLFAHWSQIGELRVGDADDALRIVQVRDLIAGQPWWDVGQHRINPLGGGGIMHWSRIVDAPLAGAIALMTPLVGADSAERIAVSVWPLVLMLALFVLAARLGERLGSKHVALLSIGLLMLANMTLFQFQPLRVDHHGWQVLLALGLAIVATGNSGARAGATGGAIAAIQMAISIEGLPYALLFAAIIGVDYAWSGCHKARAQLIAYLAMLSMAGVAILGVTRGPFALILSWCDALSAPYLAAFVAAAIAVPLLALAVGERGRWWRFGALALAGAVSGATLVAVDPACAAGPFGALDPLVRDYWYLNVREGLPAWHKGDILLPYSVAPSLVGLVGTLLAWRMGDSPLIRRRWLIMLAALTGAVVVSLLVLRTASTAHLFALPGSAWLAIHAWRRARANPRLLPRIAGSLLPALALPPIAGAAAAMLLRPSIASAPSATTLRAEAEQCSSPAALAAIDRLPPSLLFAPLDIGPHILLHSRHSVIATGHHRNQGAMRTVIDAFLSAPADAERGVRASGARYVVICNLARETEIYRANSKGGLAAVLHDGRVPDWLTPVPTPGSGAIRMYRIAPPSGAKS